MSFKEEIALQPTREAILEVYMREYGEKILQLVFLMVKDKAIAEDLTQEVFLKAYQRLHTFRGEASPKTWLYRIAINESKKYLRSWSFRRIFSTFTQKNDKLPESVDRQNVESTVIDKLSQADIAEMVMALSPQYRHVIILHYYEDLTIKEIAQVLGIKEDAVRQKLSRARRKFKEFMEREGKEWM